MVGAKIPVLEIEKLKLTEDGRGLIFYNDGTNCDVTTWSSGVNTSGSSTTKAAGWIKIHYVSGSTFGATGQTAYVPFFNYK